MHPQLGKALALTTSVLLLAVSAAGFAHGPTAPPPWQPTPDVAHQLAAQRAAWLAPKPHRPSIAYLGDSYTAGSQMGGAGGSGYPYLLTMRLGYTRSMFAVGGTGYLNGDDAHASFRYRVRDLIAAHPDVVLIEGGHNDTGRYPTPRIRDAAQHVITDIHQGLPHARIILTGILWPGTAPGYVADDNRMLRNLARREHVDFVNTITWFEGDNTVFIGKDGTHPTDEGHDYLTDQFQDALTKFTLPAGTPWPAGS